MPGISIWRINMANTGIAPSKAVPTPELDKVSPGEAALADKHRAKRAREQVAESNNTDFAVEPVAELDEEAVQYFRKAVKDGIVAFLTPFFSLQDQNGLEYWSTAMAKNMVWRFDQDLTNVEAKIIEQKQLMGRAVKQGNEVPDSILERQEEFLQRLVCQQAWIEIGREAALDAYSVIVQKPYQSGKKGVKSKSAARALAERYAQALPATDPKIEVPDLGQESAPAKEPTLAEMIQNELKKSIAAQLGNIFNS